MKPTDVNRQQEASEQIDFKEVSRQMDDRRLPHSATRLVLKAVLVVVDKFQKKIVRVIAEDFGFKDIWYFEGQNKFRRFHRVWSFRIHKKIAENSSWQPDQLPEFIHTQSRARMQKLAKVLTEILNEYDDPGKVSVTKLLLHERVRAALVLDVE